MDNLEELLTRLPQPKLRRRTDLKIKFRIYTMALGESVAGLRHRLFVRRPILRLVAVSLGALVLLLSGTSIYAYANPSLTPGDTLYPLKRVVEDIEATLAVTPEARVNTLQKFSERRLQEALHLSQEPRDKVSEESNDRAGQSIMDTIDEATRNIGSAISSSEAIGDPAIAERARGRIRGHSDEAMELLNRIEQSASSTEDHEVQDRTEAARHTIEDYQNIIDDDDREDDKSSSNQNNEDENNNRGRERTDNQNKDQGNDD